MVSIIVPAYNAEKYIDRSIQSVIDQTQEEFELIIVDDGSTDATLELAYRWQKNDIRISVVHQENQGLSGARNTGLKKARGEFIFFLDSDDWIEKNALENLLSKQKEYSADIVACGFQWVYADGHAVPFTEKKEFSVDGKKAIEEMILGRTLCSVVWNKLYRRELLHNIEFPIGKKNEDEFITYKLLYKSQIVVYSGEILYNYYQNDLGLMTGIYKELNFDKLDALWERGNWLKNQGDLLLAAYSDIELLNHVKFLYRKENVNETIKKDLREKYLYYSEKALTNPKLSRKEKIKIQFWRLFL